MKKVSKKYIDRARQKGRVVTPESVPMPDIPKMAEQAVPRASMAAVIQKVQSDNLKFIKAFGEDVKKLVGRKRKPWKFTVKETIRAL